MSTSIYRQAGVPASFDDDLVRQLALLDGETPRIAAASIALLGVGSRVRLETEDPPLITVGDDRAPVITITQNGWATIQACARALREAEGPNWADAYLERSAADFEDTYQRALEVARSRRGAGTSSPSSVGVGAC